MTRKDRIAALKAAAKERILILDGSWGVMIQRRGLDEADFLGERFIGHEGQMKGNNDILCLTRPDIVTDLHNGQYIITYYVPSAGTYTMTTGVDENPYDDEIIFTPIRGYPMSISFVNQWESKLVSGTPAKLKGYLRLFSDGEKVYAFVKDIAKDTGFPDLDTDKKLGFEKPPPKPAASDAVEGAVA